MFNLWDLIVPLSDNTKVIITCNKRVVYKGKFKNMVDMDVSFEEYHNILKAEIDDIRVNNNRLFINVNYDLGAKNVSSK